MTPATGVLELMYINIAPAAVTTLKEIIMSDANQIKPPTPPTMLKVAKQHHVPEAMSALELELTETLAAVDELTKLVDAVLNPVNLSETAVKLDEADKRAPLANRIWMNVQSAQYVRNRINAISARLEL